MVYLVIRAGEDALRLFTLCPGGDNLVRKSIWSCAIIFAAVALFLVTSPAIARDVYDQYDRLDDAGVFMLVQDVDHHFDEARADFEEKDMNGAALELRRAASFLRIEADRSTGNEQKALKASIEEIEKLARDVEDGRITSETALHDAFAKAQFALSMNYWVKAEEAFNEKDFEKAVHHLKASQGHLEQAIAWSHHKKEKKAEESKKK